MAKVSMVQREIKRTRLEKKFHDKRIELKRLAQEAYAKGEIPWEVQNALQSIPRNANPTRQHRRCALCGRPRGVYRRFGLCRLCLRKLVMEGMLAGIKKSSW